VWVNGKLVGAASVTKGVLKGVDESRGRKSLEVTYARSHTRYAGRFWNSASHRHGGRSVMTTDATEPPRKHPGPRGRRETEPPRQHGIASLWRPGLPLVAGWEMQSVVSVVPTLYSCHLRVLGKKTNPVINNL
jgi:hypothetical protein